MRHADEIVQTNQRTEDIGSADVTISNGVNVDLVVPVAVRVNSITRAASTFTNPSSGYAAFALQIIRPPALAELEQMITPSGVLQMSLDNSSWVDVPESMCFNSDSSGDTNEIAAYTGANSSQIIVVTVPVNRITFRLLFASVAEARFAVKFRFDGHQKVGNKNLMP